MNSSEVEQMRTFPPFDSFLSLPTAEELEMVDSQEYKPDIVRETADYESDSAKFIIKKKTFENQYCNVYTQRINTLKPILRERVNELWNPSDSLPVVDKLLDITQNTHCIVIGTLFKEMPLIERVLDEFAKNRAMNPIPPRDSYVSPEDTLILEDETGRTILVGEKTRNIERLVTGLVVAVKGTSLKGGEFEVQEMLFPGLADQDIVHPPKNISHPRYVALVSGLQLGANPDPLATQMMIDFLSGHLGSTGEQQLAANIVRVILAGNSLGPPELESDVSISDALKISSDKRKPIVGPLRELDALLTQLSSSMAVDIMPGESDPANYTLPQQPFNRCLMPLASQYSTFHAVPNPHECNIEGKLFVGTGGQNLDNIEKFMEVDDKLHLLEQTLEWRHLAPTAPDQLAAYPFGDKDPFIFEKCPHVYFAGNQKEYQTKLLEGPKGQKVRLVLLPSFSQSKTIVLVNLDSLDIHPMVFSTDF